MSSETIAPQLPSRKETISKGMPLSFVSLGIETWHRVKNQYNQTTMKFSRNKSNSKQDQTDIKSKSIVEGLPTLEFLKEDQSQSLVDEPPKLPPRNDNSTPNDSVSDWVNIIFSKYTQESSENNSLTEPSNKIVSKYTQESSENNNLNEPSNKIVSKYTQQSSEHNILTEPSNKTVECNQYSENVHAGLKSSDLKLLKDFGLSDVFDKDINVPLDNTKEMNTQINDAFFDKCNTPILELPDNNNESLFSFFGADIAHFLDVSSGDPIITTETQTSVSANEDICLNLNDTSLNLFQHESNQTHSTDKPPSITKSNSPQISIQEGRPTDLAASLSLATISSSASTKNEEKSNIIPQSPQNSLKNKQVFENVINDSNANFYSLLSFAKSDVKKKDYKNALKSLRFVIENLGLLDLNDMQILGTKAMVLLEKCANANVDCSIYIAYLYADGIPDIFEEDVTKALHYLLKGDRKNESECIFHAAVIIETIGSSNKEVVHYITKAAKMYLIN
jgi:hypothetical protein